MTGELGKGLIGNPISSHQQVRDHILSALKKGLDKVGRGRSDADVLVQRFAIIDDDIFAADGFSETVEQARSMQRTPETDKALELISCEMVDAFCVTGRIDRVRPKINERE